MTKQSLSLVVRSLALALALVLLAGCAANGKKSMERGKQLMKEKDYARALLEFRNAQRHFPKDADVAYQVALAYLATGDLQNGVRQLRLATEINPKHAEAQMKLSELMALNSNSDIIVEAERRAKLALAADTNNNDAIATLAFAELRLGKLDAAEKRLQEIVDKYPQALKAAIVMANLRLSQKDEKAAETIMKRAVEANSNSWEAWFSLSRFYMLLKRVPEAEAAIRKVIEIDPTNELSLQDLASLQMALGKPADAAETYKKLAAHPSKKYISAHAVFQFQQGKREEAVKELEQIFKSNSRNRTIRTQLVAGYLALNRKEDAEKVLNEAIKDNAKDVDALLQRGQIYLLANKLDQLEKDMTEVLKFKPDSGEAHYLMARLHRARLSPKNEERELYEALKLAPALLAARIDMAQHLITSGGGKAALDLLDAAPAEQRNLLPTIVQRNWALWALKDFAKMKEGIETGYQFGRVPDILLQESLLKLQDRKFGPARELLKEAAKARPDDLRIVQTLAESHLLENKANVQAAVNEVQTLAAQYPKSARLQQLRGNWLVAAGKLDEGRQAFEAAKAADPTFKGATFALAQVDMSKGDLTTARKNLDELLSKDAKDASALLLIAMLDEKAGQTDKATESYRKVIDAEPTNAIALNNLAYRLVMDNSRADEALKFAQKAKEVAPASPAIDDTLGWIYYQKGLYSSAVKHLESATNGPNASPVRLFHLSMAYYKAGNLNKARETYNKAFKIGPLLPEATLAKQTLGL